MASFAKSIANLRNKNVYLVCGGRDHTQRPAWYFVRVDNVKTKAFLRAIESSSVELSAFGEIIESGYGEQPSEAMRSHMKVHYGFAG